jgi:hypothetical protein
MRILFLQLITPLSNFLKQKSEHIDTPQLPVNSRVKIIVRQVCIETWFIGQTDHYLTAKESPDKGINYSWLNMMQKTTILK